MQDYLMKTINRTLLIVIPKKPYLEWAKSFENGDDDFDTNEGHYSGYLISEKYDEFNYKNYLKNHYMDIFEEELYSMIRDPDLWPQKRDFKTYNEWFDTKACDVVYDLSNESVEIEEF
jgi:hypothetical protein